MSKKVIIILIIGIIILGGGSFWYITAKNSAKTAGRTDVTFKDFVPFGSSAPANNISGTDINGDGKITNEDNIDPTILSSKFEKITNFAIAGTIFFTDTRPVNQTEENSNLSEFAPSIRYVEKANGHIYQKYIDLGTEAKISNSTIPSVYEVLFSGEGKNLIYRYLSADRKTISSFLGTLGSSSGEFLPENISDITVSPDGNRFFYLTPFSGGTTGTIRNFGETKKTQIFSSSFSEWLPQWASPQTIFLTTKASYSEIGHIYSLNPSTGAFSRVLGGIQGLTTLVSPNGNLILYSFSSNQGPKLSIFNISTRENKNTGLFGLPEKCLWDKESINIYCGIPGYINKTEPDSWYQGLTSFNDSFVKIEAQTGSNSTLAQPEEGIDATHLFFGDRNQTLYFINKKDFTLWSLKLD